MGGLLDTRGSALSWCRRERIGGDAALAAGPRSTRAAALTREHELALVDTIRDRYPADLGIAGDLWSRRTVAALAATLFGTAPPGAVITRLLATWGVVAQNPSSRACPLCAGAVDRWMTTAYPAIAASALTHRATLAWLGRTRLCGVTPPSSVLSAVSGFPGRPRTRFTIATDDPRATLPRDFLVRLSGRQGRPLHAIADGSWATWQLPRRLPARVVLHPMPSCERP